MKNHKKLICCGFLLLFVVMNAYPGKNPISWQLNQPFPSAISTDSSYNIIYTLTNQLPFQLVHPLVIEKNPSPASEFLYVDACTGKRLLPQERCTVQITLTPLVVGQKYFQIILAGYDNNRVPLPTLTSIASGQGSGSIQGVVATPLAATLTVGTPSSYEFRFYNKSSQTVTGVSAESSVLGFATTCGSELAGGGAHCSVIGSYTPDSSSPSIQTVTGTFSYSQGAPVSVSTSTTVTSGTGVKGIVVTALPPVMAAATPAPYSFKFCNENPNQINITSAGVSDAGSGGTVNPTLTPGDCNSITYLPNTGCCTISGTYTTPASGNITLTASLGYTYNSTPDTAAVATYTVVGTIPSQRVFTLTNQCSFEVWVSMTGGALPANDFTAPCDSTSCPHGSSCDLTTGVCFWENYAPSSYSLAGFSGGTPASTTITILAGSPDSTIKWSGGISASTGCTGTGSTGVCNQADCENQGGTASCAPGKGFSTPSTQAEFTLLNNNIDSYDVTVINGFHLPIQMLPAQPALVSNYSCGAAGGNPGGNGFGACLWSGAVLPSNQYYWVTDVAASTSGSCTLGNTTTCSANYLCGINSTTYTVGCGEFLGFWTGDEICGLANVPTATRELFNCDVPLSTLAPSGSPSFSPTPTGYTNPLTLQDLMLCAVNSPYVGPVFNTCYQTYSSSSYNSDQISSCCGCSDWWNDSYNGSNIGANSNTSTCLQYGPYNTDPVWDTNVKNTLIWMKAACPSDYVYPFDDKTSTFTCSNNTANQANTVNYDITFCPGGDSGLPVRSPTITDGR